MRGNETENPSSANPVRGLPKNLLQVHCFDISEREGRSQAEMGLPATWKAAERHHAGVQGGLRPEHNWKAARRLRSVQSRPEGKNEADRLSKTSR